MLTIRLQRAGKKNKPEYRIVLAEKTSASQKKFTEVMGAYNPHTKALTIRNQERLDYWMNEQHVELSATVRNLLISKEIIKGDKTKAFTIPKKEVVAEEAPAEEAISEVAEEAPAEEAISEVAETPAVEETVEAASEVVAEEAPVTETPAETEAPEEEKTT